MHFARVLLPCLIGVMVGTTASAEIYESKDAQGNTVFSDRPSTGAEEIRMPPTNSADPVVETPRPTPSPEKSEAPAKPRKRPATPAGSEYEEMDDDYLYYGDNMDRDDSEEQTGREQRRDREDGARPKGDRSVVTPHRNAPRPAGGGGGRR